MRNSKEQTQLRQPHRICKCGACEPKRPKLPEGVRRLKVYDKHINGEARPVIILQGEWLRSSRFNIGDEVLVTVEKNKLTIESERKAED